MDPKPLIIIGGGVFGLSTALSAMHQGYKVTVFSENSDLAAHSDISKIVRIDYTSRKRMLEAQRAQKAWETEPLFKPYYKQNHRFVIFNEQNLQMLDKINEARSQCGLRKREETNDRGAYQSHNTAPDKLVWTYNHDDGQVDWANFIPNFRKYLAQRGCEFYITKVRKAIHEDGKAVALDTVSSGEIPINNAELVLAPGAWTLSLFQESKINPPPSIKPTGIFAFEVKLDKEVLQRIRDAPVISEIGTGKPHVLCYEVYNSNESLS